MNKSQWSVFAIGSHALAFLMIKISLQWKGYCGLDVVDMTNIYACIRGEVFAPYPYIFFGLGIIFMIVAFLEKGK